MFKYKRVWDSVVIEYEGREYVLFKNLYEDFVDDYEETKGRLDEYDYFYNYYADKIQNRLIDVVPSDVLDEDEDYVWDFLDWIYETFIS